VPFSIHADASLSLSNFEEVVPVHSGPVHRSRRRSAFLLRRRLPASIFARLPEGVFELVVRAL